MGNIAYKQNKCNHLARLALLELQLCFQPLDRLSRLRLSRTCHALLQASQSTFAWKYAPPVDLTLQFPSDQPPPPIVDVPIFHSLVRFCETNLVWKDPIWRQTPKGGYVMDPPSIDEIDHVRHYPNVQSITINRRHMTASQIDAFLLENDNLVHLRTFSLDQSMTCEIDFAPVLRTLLTFQKLQHCVLLNVKFTYATYYDFMQLPALTSCGFMDFFPLHWTDAETKSVAEFQFPSKITHLHLHSLGVRPEHPASMALVNHLLSRVSHLTIEHCFGVHDEQNFALFASALKSLTHLVTRENKSQSYRLLIQLTRSPAAAPNLSHWEINSSMHYPPNVDYLITLLDQRPNIHIRFHPFYCDAYTHEKQRRCHRHVALLEGGPHAHRFQLILPKPEPFWKSFQWPGIPQ